MRAERDNEADADEDEARNDHGLNRRIECGPPPT
jgi:hypothetical protein